jgi:hypothetical protein
MAWCLRTERADKLNPLQTMMISSETHGSDSIPDRKLRVRPASCQFSGVRHRSQAFILRFYNSINLQGVVLMFRAVQFISNLRHCRLVSP